MNVIKRVIVWNPSLLTYRKKEKTDNKNNNISATKKQGLREPMISDQTWMFEIEKHVFSLHVMIFFFVDVFKNSFTSILKILRTIYNLRHSEPEYLVPSKWDLTCYIK